MAIELDFLTIGQVLEIHTTQINQFGGDRGIRDYGLLASSVAAPQNRFYYEPEVTVYDLAATYAYSISHNHPFVDGNKRAALNSALAFLTVNGFVVNTPLEVLYKAMIDLVTDRITKSSFASILSRNQG